METILDGTGSGKRLKIDSNNRAVTQAIIKDEMTDVSERDGEAYIFASGDFTALTTTDTETGFFYLLNDNPDKELHIKSIRTCGDVVQKWRLYKEVSGGTLISNAVAGSSNNINLTKSNTAQATVYKGADGDTVTGGTMLEHWINGVGYSTEDLDGALVLGKGDSLTLTAEVPTAGDLCCRIVAYYEEPVR